jgi:hypothetical protein
MCFVWISEQKAIISLYVINWLVLITETKCLLHGSRLNVIKTDISLYTGFISGRSSKFCVHQRVHTAVKCFQCAVRYVVELNSRRTVEKA